MIEHKYTIDHSPINYVGGSLKVGDWIDCLTGAIIIGPYCIWPKSEPRRFYVVGGRRQGKTLTMKLAQELRNMFK